MTVVVGMFEVRINTCNDCFSGIQSSYWKKKTAYNSFLEKFIYYKLTSSKISTNSVALDIFL